MFQHKTSRFEKLRRTIIVEVNKACLKVKLFLTNLNMVCLILIISPFCNSYCFLAQGAKLLYEARKIKFPFSFWSAIFPDMTVTW